MDDDTKTVLISIGSFVIGSLLVSVFEDKIDEVKKSVDFD